MPKYRGPQFSPPLRGGVAATLITMSRSFLYGADGVVIKFRRILLRLNTTPSARAKDASRRFLDRAATPPRRGGEDSPLHLLGQQPREAGEIRDKSARGPEGRKIDSHNLTPLRGWAHDEPNPGLRPGLNSYAPPALIHSLIARLSLRGTTRDRCDVLQRRFSPPPV